MTALLTLSLSLSLSDVNVLNLEDCLLTARAVQEEEIPFAEMFVAMSLGADGESIEVKQLLHR